MVVPQPGDVTVLMQQDDDVTVAGSSPTMTSLFRLFSNREKTMMMSIWMDLSTVYG
jgi:hypothetical protein